MKQQIKTPELEAFHSHVVNLNGEFQMLEELYTAENASLFYRTAPLFFEELRVRLLIHLIQSIGRLFDPSKMKNGNKNLSLDAIAQRPEIAPIAVAIKKRIAAVRLVWEKDMKTWRHKAVAHSDMATATGKKSLPDIPWDDAVRIVSEITAIAREIQHQLNAVDADYRLHYGSGWVPDLLRVLRAGIEKLDADKERRA